MKRNKDADKMRRELKNTQGGFFLCLFSGGGGRRGGRGYQCRKNANMGKIKKKVLK